MSDLYVDDEQNLNIGDPADLTDANRGVDHPVIASSSGKSSSPVRSSSDHRVEDEQILNISGPSGFPDANHDIEHPALASGSGKNYLIHVRIQQRTGRKVVTTIQGLPQELDLKKLNKHLRKEFKCLGTVVNHDEYGEVIQLSGDQRKNIYAFLSEKMKISNDQIKVHGF